jgi:alpha-mannosidase
MSQFQPYTRRNLPIALNAIHQSVYNIVATLGITAWRSKEPLPFSQRTNGEELHLKIGDRWGELFDCAWFCFSGRVPPEAKDHAVVLLLDVNGELCVFDDQGTPMRGLTNIASEYDKSLGMPGKKVMPMFDTSSGDENVVVWADAGCNDLFGFIQDSGVIRQAYIAILNPEIRGLYYDFEVLLDCLKVLPEKSPRYEQVTHALQVVTHMLWNGITIELAQQARQVLAPELKLEGGDPSLNITAIGHAHMDLGWLWPIRETHRKGARTFATALANMDLYPGYKFAASQAQLFQWIKDDHPALYAKIQQKVMEGRIEPQGALWVECDTNLTGGESLVRQILYGKRFFTSEFGIDPSYVWLPDTFGYSAALPQIIQRSGMQYFSTQKLSWSLINNFPHHSFNWQGIDGSRILVHMLPEETYNSPAAPRSITKIETNYAQKGVSRNALMIFGIGDGGGGPGEEHLERLNRISNLAGFSPVSQAWTAEFFPKLASEAHQFPTWVGELYLERHQGTLTTNAANKWFNRRMEQTLRELEWTATLATLLTGTPYPASQLESIWKEVLLYQFHDILPGSSIKRVYDESLARYKALQFELEQMISQAQETIASQVQTNNMEKPYILFNSLPWQRQNWVKIDHTWHKVSVPAMGFTTIDVSRPENIIAPVLASPESLENDCLLVRFDQDGGITSLFDKKLHRELVPPGESMNQLVKYTDHGDAWDIPMDYADSTPTKLPLTASRAGIDGPRAFVEQTYKIGSSHLVQEISLTMGSPVLEFKTSLKWLEKASMLRAVFPTTIFSEEAVYEIQYGHVRRSTHQNTTWDLAKDEVPAQKWVDLSQRDYGLAILNDSKYGHRIKGNTIEISLLRSVLYPGQRVVMEGDTQPGEPDHAYTDQTDHNFRYAVYPHPGDFCASGVIQAAYEFNHPLRMKAAENHQGNYPRSHAFITINKPNIILETMKWSEDENSFVIRLYESWRAQTRVELLFGFTVQSIQEANLMEVPENNLLLDGEKVTLDFRPFEIKTLIITRPS